MNNKLICHLFERNTTLQSKFKDELTAKYASTLSKEFTYSVVQLCLNQLYFGRYLSKITFISEYLFLKNYFWSLLGQLLHTHTKTHTHTSYYQCRRIYIFCLFIVDDNMYLSKVHFEPQNKHAGIVTQTKCRHHKEHRFKFHLKCW